MKGSSRKMIAEAINSIPEKKEKLRKALESLQSYSSSLLNFTLEWKDLEDHFSAIEKSIDEQFRAVQEKEVEEGVAPTAATPVADDALVTAAAPYPRPELRSLCANMDAKGLRSYISDNRKDLLAIREELAPAIRCAPDPALLILDAMEGFYPPNYSNTSKSRYRKLGSNNNEEGEIQINRRTCINLLDNLQLIYPVIKPSVRDKAKKLALEWKANISKTSYFALEALGFLQLIAYYGLVPEFQLDQVMELFTYISQRKQAVDLIKSLKLDDKLPGTVFNFREQRSCDADEHTYIFNDISCGCVVNVVQRSGSRLLYVR